MEVKDKVVIVTGGASGIGLALCTRFAEEGARVVLSDLNADNTQARAEEIGATGIAADASQESQIAQLVKTTLERHGQIDMFCSNAGVVVSGGPEVAAERWELSVEVNAMAHVYAARHVLPHMLARGSGYLLNTASAGGLLTEFHSAPYTMSKHAAVGFAEWLAVTYGDRGIGVSVLCPAGVVTPMTANTPSLLKNAITTDELVDDVIAAIAEERFMISTHAWVLELFAIKGHDYQAYIQEMRRQRAAYAAADEQAA